MNFVQTFRRRPLILGEALPPGVSRPFDYKDQSGNLVETTTQLLRVIYGDDDEVRHKQLLSDFSLVNCLDRCLGKGAFRGDKGNREDAERFLAERLEEAGDFTPEDSHWPAACQSEGPYERNPKIPLLYGRAVFMVGGVLETFEAAFHSLGRKGRMRGEVNFITVAPSIHDGKDLEVCSEVFFLTHPSIWDRQYQGKGNSREHLPAIQALFTEARLWRQS